jgi:hypothetical protein
MCRYNETCTHLQPFTVNHRHVFRRPTLVSGCTRHVAVDVNGGFHAKASPHQNVQAMSPVMMDTHASSRSPYTRPQRRRPASLAELAERARNNGWDPNLGIKHWLKTAEKHRNKGNALVSSGDLEAGFVELATAATIVLEKVPNHREYSTMLNPTLRKNLGEVRVPWKTFRQSMYRRLSIVEN